MAWVYLDDHFPEHPKVARAGGDAAWLFVCGLAYCRRHGTEGLIPKAVVPMLSDRKAPVKLATRLVEVELWDDAGDSYQVHNYGEWNKPQESRTEAARKAARARWNKPPDDASRNANASESHSERMSEPDASPCPMPLAPAPSVTTSSGDTTVVGAPSTALSLLDPKKWESHRSEVDLLVMALSDEFTAAKVEKAVDQLIDSGRCYPWPSNIDKALRASLVAEKKPEPHPLDEPQQAQRQMQEEGVAYSETIAALPRDPEAASKLRAMRLQTLHGERKGA